MQRERYDDAEVILNKIAEKNGTKPPDISVLKKFVKDEEMEEKLRNNFTYIDLFRQWTYCKRTLILAVGW